VATDNDRPGIVSRPRFTDHVRESLFIDGQWRPSGTSSFQVVDCVTGEAIGQVPAATTDELSDAVAAASRAWPGWSRTSHRDRARGLRRLHDELASRRDVLTSLICAEVGTVARLCPVIQVDSALRSLQIAADLAESFSFEEQIANSVVVKSPVGVVGAITPWNYPLFQTVAKVGPALAAGCSVVHKPSELAPLTAFVLADAFAAADLPGGVYNLVTGEPKTIGEGLVGHPQVNMVSFTGSTATGTRVYELAAAGIKRVALEMGGKSASVVLPDADLPSAVKATANRAFLNSGQTCDAWTRLVVPAESVSDVVDLLGESVSRLVLGDPFDPASRLGPLISARQAGRVREYITEAVDAGAKLAYGGAQPPARFAAGNFVEATVVTDVLPGMRIAHEEVFGPVLAVLGYRDVDEALQIANGTDYGLCAAVWSADQDRATAFAREIRAGQVVINGGTYNPLAPFGGLKRSGIGREFGQYGLEEFLEPIALQYR
jgi:aldehyde dehydrogenase (NAD+)